MRMFLFADWPSLRSPREGTGFVLQIERILLIFMSAWIYLDRQSIGSNLFPSSID